MGRCAGTASEPAEVDRTAGNKWGGSTATWELQQESTVKRVVMMVFAMAACGGVPLGCAATSPPATTVARVPMSYTRSFDAPKEQTFRATVTALETFGYKVALADPERGVLKTTPKVHRLARVRSSSAGDLVPLSHAFVVSVREKAPGSSVVTGYLRTFSSERETTAVGKPNEPIVDEMWTRLFAEVASDLRR